MKYITNNQFTGFLLFIFALLLFIAGCNNKTPNNDRGDQIEFNKENARRHVMKVEEALTFTTRFKQNRDRAQALLAKDPYFSQNAFRLLNGEYFNRDAIIALLNKAPKGGIRIYLGQDKEGTVKLVMVPATDSTDVITTLLASNALKLPGLSSAQAAPVLDGDVMERGQECPNLCPIGSPFTSR